MNMLRKIGMLEEIMGLVKDGLDVERRFYETLEAELHDDAAKLNLDQRRSITSVQDDLVYIACHLFDAAEKAKGLKAKMEKND